MRRTTTYNEDVSKRLKNPRYAREFIKALIEGSDAIGLEEALKHTIEVMGVKEYSELTGMTHAYIVDFVKGRRHPKIETLDQMLRPFKLKTKLILEIAG